MEWSPVSKGNKSPKINSHQGMMSFDWFIGFSVPFLIGFGYRTLDWKPLYVEIHSACYYDYQLSKARQSFGDEVWTRNYGVTTGNFPCVQRQQYRRPQFRALRCH